MTPKQSEAMFRLIGVDKKALRDALDTLRKNAYYHKAWREESSNSITSAIVSCVLYCYVPNLPQGTHLVHLMFDDSSSRSFIAFPREVVESFDPQVHIEQIYEGRPYVIIDLMADAAQDQICYERGHIIRYLNGYWPPKSVQFLAESLGYEHEMPLRCSSGWTPSPEVEAECEHGRARYSSAPG